VSHPMTAQDLWALPRVGTPRAAPDGRHAAVPVTTYDVDANEGTARLWLVPLDGSDPRPLTGPDASASQPAWSPTGDRLLFVRKPGGAAGKGGRKPRYPDQPQLYLLRLDGGEPERLTDLPLGVMDPRFFPDGRRVAFVAPLLADAPTADGTADLAKARADDPVKAYVTEDRVYRYWDRWLTDGQTHHLFVLDLETRAMVDLTPGMRRWLDLFEPADKYRVSPDGCEIAFSANLSDPPYSPLVWGVFTVAVPDEIRPDVPPPAPAPLPGLPAGHAGRPVYSPDGRYIVYGHQHDIDFYADRERLVAFDRQAGTHTELTDAWDASAAGWTFGADAGTVYLAAEAQGRTALYALDLAAAVTDPAGTAPRELVRGGWLGDPEVVGDRIVATYQSLVQPPEVWTCALDGSGGYLASHFTGRVLGDVTLSEVRSETFAGADGEPVQMFLLYPPGFQPPAPGERPERPLPLVQLIHGGPHGVFGDQWHWRWCAHLFAAPGYLVALVNFHGSTGFGEAFTKSILGQWGDRPFADLMAATDHLVARGLADPARMAATGGSYGGYMVSWIAGHTDRFACLVNHAGVSDFQAQHATDITQGRRRSFGGDLVQDTAAMDYNNPLRHAAHFKSPLLVIHGQRDYRVPYVQGLQMYNVYQALGLPSRLVVYPDENHWVLKPKNSLHWYGEFLAWLARWLGPTPPG
jgi:dipeptidyl aminopeptidase/acylaminoacyl peptidase